MKLVTYCSSTDTYCEIAREVGRIYVSTPDEPVYGGGGKPNTGMRALADGWIAAGAPRQMIGVIPEEMVEREWAYRHPAVKLEVVKDMPARISRFREYAADPEGAVYVVMPGGFGSTEEFMAALTVTNLGLWGAAPILMIDPDRWYAGLLSWLHELVERGAVSKKGTGLSRVTTLSDVDQLPDILIAERLGAVP